MNIYNKCFPHCIKSRSQKWTGDLNHINLMNQLNQRFRLCDLKITLITKITVQTFLNKPL